MPESLRIQGPSKPCNNKLNGLDECRKEISDLTTLVNILKEQNKDKDKKILELETRVDELEQYTRQDDLVISGLKTRHKSYARATVSEQLQDSQNAPYEEMESLEDHVTRFVEDKMGVRLLSTDVSICHKLPLYMSPVPDHNAWDIDTLNINWSDLTGYT